jgi:hypothetical protein
MEDKGTNGEATDYFGAATLRVGSMVLATNLALNAGIPKGWFLAGSNPQDYETVVGHGSPRRSPFNSAFLKSIVPRPLGFGTLMQTVRADAYRGKRVRLSSYVRSESVHGWAGLWMRVDGPQSVPLAFDNMQNRPINGTSNWTKCDVVLDVPESARSIALGLLLTGAGQVWMDDLIIQTVDKKSVPATGATRSSPRRASLKNNTERFREYRTENNFVSLCAD